MLIKPIGGLKTNQVRSQTCSFHGKHKVVSEMAKSTHNVTSKIPKSLMALGAVILTAMLAMGCPLPGTEPEGVDTEQPSGPSGPTGPNEPGETEIPPPTKAQETMNSFNDFLSALGLIPLERSATEGNAKGLKYNTDGSNFKYEKDEEKSTDDNVYFNAKSKRIATGRETSYQLELYKTTVQDSKGNTLSGLMMHCPEDNYGELWVKTKNGIIIYYVPDNPNEEIGPVDKLEPKTLTEVEVTAAVGGRDLPNWTDVEVLF